MPAAVDVRAPAADTGPPAPARPRAVAWLPLAPALLLSALGGVLVGQRQPLWYDELYTAAVAPVPLGELGSAVLAGEGTAPYLDGVPPSYNAGFYVVAHLWLRLTPFGADDVGLRLLSLLAAVGAVAVLTRAAERMAGPAVGLAAGLMAAANPLVVEYAAEARGYGLALLATAVTMLGLARWLQGGGLLLYGLGAAAMGLAHWFAVPALGGLALAALLLRRRAAVRLLAVTATALLPVGALVVLAVVNGAGGDNVGFIRDTGLALPWVAVRAWSAQSGVLLAATLVAVAVGTLSAGRLALRTPPPGGSSLGGASLGGSSLGGSSRRRSSVRRVPAAPVVLGACWVGLPLLLLTAAQLLRPVFVPRYLLPSLLGLAVLAALGTATWRRPVAVAATGGLVVASLWAGLPLLERGPREDGPAVVAHLAERVATGQPVVAADPRATLALVHYGERLDDVVLPPADAPPGAEVVWLVRELTPTGPLPSDDDALLAARGLRVAQEHVVDGSSTRLVVQRWTRPD